MLLLILRYWLLSAGIAMFVVAAGILTYDTCLLIASWRKRSKFDSEAGALGLAREADAEIAPNSRWRTLVAFGMLAWAPLVILAGILIASSGVAGMQMNRTQATVAGTLSARNTLVTR
jgi:hypothetical protein